MATVQINDDVITTDMEQIDTNRFQGVVTIVGRPGGIRCTAAYVCHQTRLEPQEAIEDADRQVSVFYEIYKREHALGFVPSRLGSSANRGG